MKIHLHRFDSQTRPRNLCHHAQRNSLIGLDANDEDVLIMLGAVAIKQDHGRFLKVHRNFSGGFGETFPDPQVNRHL